MGVNVVCLMPVHPISKKNRRGLLGSPYSVADYGEVNPEFGTLEDLKNFVAIAHLIGMRVILDEPCGYSGTDHPWVEAHPEYYARTDSGALVSPSGRPDVYVYDYSNPEWRRAMIEALALLVDEADIDGFRFAAASEVPNDFWVRARKTLQHVKPIMFVAEGSDPDFVKEAFDADYNRAMIDTLNAIAATQSVNRFAYDRGQRLPRTDSEALLRLINAQSCAYPKGSLHVSMTGNNDLNRHEGTEKERYSDDANRTFTVLTFTLPGIPMFTTGQEVGHGKSFAVFGLDSLPDFTPNHITELYTKLESLRKLHPALWQEVGNEARIKLIPTGNSKVLAFEREAYNDRILVVANLSRYQHDLNFPDGAPDMRGLTNHLFSIVGDLPAQLQPWEFHIFAMPQTSDESIKEPRKVIIENTADSSLAMVAAKDLEAVRRYNRILKDEERDLQRILEDIRAGKMPEHRNKTPVRKKPAKPILSKDYNNGSIRWE